MRAFLYDGQGLGSDHADVTNEYKSLKALKRYAINRFLKVHNFCHADIFYNWDNRYGKADKIMEFTNNPMRCDQCSWCHINGIFIHEKGCPNDHKHWSCEDGVWEDEEIEEDDDYGYSEQKNFD